MAQRPYNALDLKELMESTGGWAKNWDHVLRYLHGPAVRDSDFPEKKVPALLEDIEGVKRRGIKFTVDYRNVWEAITGEKTRDLPPPKGVVEPATNPIELEDQYLKDLSFPATKEDVRRTAHACDAPERVMAILSEIEDKRYGDLGELLEAIGERSWNHD